MKEKCFFVMLVLVTTLHLLLKIMYGINLLDQFCNALCVRPMEFLQFSNDVFIESNNLYHH